MSKEQQRRNNELQDDVAGLGEWDHGTSDNVFPYKGSRILSYQELKRMVLQVEDQMEGTVRNTFHRVEEHAVEELIHRRAFGDELTGVQLENDHSIQEKHSH